MNYKNMSIYICIIIILIFLIIFFINMHGKNDINYERHLYDNNKYEIGRAHV